MKGINMSKTWQEKWIEDIDYLVNNLISKHKNLFFNIKKEKFYDIVMNLKLMVNELEYEEMKVELSRVVASIKDAHTSISFPVNKFLPFKFYYFSDGIYIVETTIQYEEVLYKKVVAINKIPIEEVIQELSQIISYENEYFLKAQLIKYLQASDVLYGLLISDDINEITVTISDGKEEKDIKVDTLKSKELDFVRNKKIPLYLKRSDENYWFQFLEDKKELYIKYNSCKEYGEEILENKIEKTIEFIEQNEVNKLTIDLRHNLGGDSTLVQPLIEFIKNHDGINKKGNLKVIIGRETFSSGLLNTYQFKLETNAILIGEPSGGKPNCYGEVLRFTLPNSGFVVSYSTEYYRLIEDDSVMALCPDEIIEESILDRTL